MGYAPRPGSVAARVFALLRSPGAPDAVSSVYLQAALRKPAASHIWAGCAHVVEQGLLVRWSENGRTYYALPSAERERRAVGRVMAWTAQQALAVRELPHQAISGQAWDARRVGR